MSKTTAKPATPSTKPAGPVAQAWQLWDSIAGGEPLPRAMMVDLAMAEGVNYWTARTQAQLWLKARAA